VKKGRKEEIVSEKRQKNPWDVNLVILKEGEGISFWKGEK
jgi:hypothetical protein